MGRIVPLGQIQVGSVLPDNTYRVCVKLSETQTKEAAGKVQKYMLKLAGKVIEPKPTAGRPYYDNFVIGTNDDPDAELLETWTTSIGGKQFKGFLNKTGIAFGEEEDIEAIIGAVDDVEVLASVVLEIQAKTNRDGSPNQYAGRPSNNTKAYWAIGEKEPGDVAASTSPVAATRTIKPTVTGVKTTTGRVTGTGAAVGKPAPSQEVTCTACRKRVPKGEMKAHVDQHIKDMNEGGTGEAPADDGDE